MSDFEVEVGIRVEPERVWRALTDPVEIPQWFGWDADFFELTSDWLGWWQGLVEGGEAVVHPASGGA